MVVGMKMCRDLTLRKDIGHFIGPRGSNIRNLQRSSGAMVYRDFNLSGSNRWLVFYPDDNALLKVKRAMGY
jgi:KH domain